MAEDVPCFGCWILRNKSGPEMSPCELAAIVPEVTINNLRDN